MPPFAGRTCRGADAALGGVAWAISTTADASRHKIRTLILRFIINL